MAVLFGECIFREGRFLGGGILVPMMTGAYTEGCDVNCPTSLARSWEFAMLGDVERPSSCIH
jgi:hypothetical protein